MPPLHPREGAIIMCIVDYGERALNQTHAAQVEHHQLLMGEERPAPCIYV